jgi:hypothetical protein
MTRRPTSSRQNPPTKGETAADRRVQALRQAAKDKHNHAVRRAESGIRGLVKEGHDINFRAVARAAGVSLDFLYAQPDLRSRIETLRDQCKAIKPSRPAQDEQASGNGTLVHTLTATLRRERTAHRESVADLEQRLAATHGEILRLRRKLQEHGLQS